MIDLQENSKYAFVNDQDFPFTISKIGRDYTLIRWYHGGTDQVYTPTLCEHIERGMVVDLEEKQ